MKKIHYFLSVIFLYVLFFCSSIWAAGGILTITSPSNNENVQQKVSIQASLDIPSGTQGPISIEVNAYDQSGVKIAGQKITVNVTQIEAKSAPKKTAEGLNSVQKGVDVQGSKVNK